MTTRRRKRGLRARVLILVFGLVLALILAEVGARLLWSGVKAPADVATNYPMGPKPFPGRGFFPRPGSVFQSQYDGDPFDTLPEGDRLTYRLNAAGFRDREFPNNGLAGNGVVVLGDSFVFGEGVPADRRLTWFIEQMTGETVLNLGVSGYSTEDEGDVAAALIPILKPRVVLVGYCLNDPVHLLDPEYGERFGFDLVMRRDGQLDGEGGKGESPFYIVRLIRRHLETRRLTRETLDWYRDMYRDDSSPWARSRTHLLRIRDIAAANGAAMGVFVMPIFFRLDDEYPFAEQHRTVVEWCERQDIPAVDLLPLFEGRDPEELVIHPKDHHPNAAAHREMAGRIAGFTELNFPGR